MITIEKSKKLKNKPLDESKLAFGRIFTDHMFTMAYNEEAKWHDPKIVEYKDFLFSPATLVFHYGQTIFEGLKAYKSPNDKILLFRPKDNFARFNRSAEQLCIPKIDEEFALSALKELLKTEKDWIPKTKGSSLYIRPTIIATDPFIGLGKSATYLFFIILSPVGPYFSKGFNPIKIMVTKDHVRAVRKGVGEAKTAANYAASLYATVDAQKKGYSQVLWLDGIEQKYIEEVGSMNIFFVIKDELVTPQLNGSILAGITRDSVLKIAKKLNIKTSERKISIDEIIDAHKKNELKEAFGAGTAAVISPVGEIAFENQTMEINNGQTGEISKMLFNTITDLQYGHSKDDSEQWIEEV